MKSAEDFAENFLPSYFFTDCIWFWQHRQLSGKRGRVFLDKDGVHFGKDGVVKHLMSIRTAVGKAAKLVWGKEEA